MRTTARLSTASLFAAALLGAGCGGGFGPTLSGGGDVSYDPLPPIPPVDSHDPSVSADGRFIAFASDATNLVADDTNGFRDVFVRDMTAGTTVRMSVDSLGVEADGRSDSPSISADGRYVVFESFATNLVTGAGSGRRVFVHDRSTGVTVLASAHP